MGYYSAIGDSLLAQVVNIRSKILKHKKLEKYEQEFKRENPQYFNWRHKSADDQKAEDWVMSMWNKS